MTGSGLRRRVLGVLVAAALTGAVACTDHRARPVPAHLTAALRRAERATDGADSARVRSTTSLGTQMSLRADGTLGWGDGLTGAFTLAYTGGTALDTMRRLGSTSMETRYLPDAYYARMGDAFAAQTGGKHWIRYGYAEVDGLDQVRDTTPDQAVKLLLAAGDLKRVGAERVGAVDTTHYAGTVAVADLAERHTGLATRERDALREQLTRAGVTKERVEIWVDGRDLLVKKVEKGETASGAYSQTAHYSDYGVKVSVARPPAGDTGDFKDLTTGRSAAPDGG
ncbi:hypothetical protein [Streptomyces sp. NPDC094437]|uniref:hypothetical protein n=1 Tax=Streptomyces sp. NPDC094437 TaxID=3366060 RepID=UPI0038222349